MTTAERLEARGEARGRIQGRVETFLQLITLEFGPPGEDVRARVASAEVDALTRWTARILTAETLDDVFD